MATKNDTPIDKDKEVLMEVRGIIDGCIESGSTDYKTAVEQISDISTAHLCDGSIAKRGKILTYIDDKLVS